MNTIDQAIAFAAKAHRGQTRKGTGIPYIMHPFSAAMILARVGAAENAIVAALLHDTLEDTDTTEGELRHAFGDHVTELVLGCSEPDKSLPWEERKEHTVAYLATAPMDVLLVSCADKLHNLRSLEADLIELGENVWARFKRGKDQQGWYYRHLVASLARLNTSPEGESIYREMRAIVRRIWGGEGT